MITTFGFLKYNMHLSSFSQCGFFFISYPEFCLSSILIRKTQSKFILEARIGILRKYLHFTPQRILSCARVCNVPYQCKVFF